jgi:hypothetical protein
MSHGDEMARIVSKALVLPFAFLLLFAFSACSKTPDKQIVGTWGLDVEAAFAELPEEQREAARGFMSELEMSVTINGNGTISMRAKMGDEDETKSGTWTTASMGDNSIKIAITLAGDEDEEAETDEMDITIVDGNTIRMDMNGQAMTFNRR